MPNEAAQEPVTITRVAAWEPVPAARFSARQARSIADAPAPALWENCPMSITALHEQVDGLGSRLATIGSMAAAVHRFADETRNGEISGALIDRLEEIERELLLATHDLEVVRGQAALERRSLSGASDERSSEGARRERRGSAQ